MPKVVYDENEKKEPDGDQSEVDSMQVETGTIQGDPVHERSWWHCFHRVFLRPLLSHECFLFLRLGPGRHVGGKPHPVTTTTTTIAKDDMAVEQKEHSWRENHKVRLDALKNDFKAGEYGVGNFSKPSVLISSSSDEDEQKEVFKWAPACTQLPSLFGDPPRYGSLIAVNFILEIANVEVRKFTLDFQASETVLNVKCVIADMLQFSCKLFPTERGTKLVLAFGADENLDDKRPLKWYRIKDGDTVRVSSVSPISQS